MVLKLKSPVFVPPPPFGGNVIRGGPGVSVF